MNGKEITRSIVARTLVCGTVGLGYVGLPLAVEKAKAGFKTIGFDVQADKVDMVNRGENYIATWCRRISPRSWRPARSRRPATSRASPSAASSPSACPRRSTPTRCPTPPTWSVRARDSPYIREGCMVVLESTTYPGTTES